MTYVMSDLHGAYEKYKAMLEKIHFSEDDKLYILGDMVDRGENGIAILQDIMHRKNAIPLLGNHDNTMAMLILNYANLDKKIGHEQTIHLFALWFADGGKPTFEGITKLSKEERADVLFFVDNMCITAEIQVGDKKYFMSHTLPPFEENMVLDNYPMQAFLDGHADYDKVYLQDTIMITGHLPTKYIDKNFNGKIWQGNHHIALDCGCGFGGPLGCLRLDDMEEFYVN